jgi:Domain of unknown function (DUF4349)
MSTREPTATLSPEQQRELDAIDAALGGDIVPADLAELEELVREVRAEAPEMSPRFAAELSERARDGFPRRSRRQGRSGTRRALSAHRIGLIAAPAAAGLAALAVVLSGGLSGGSSPGGSSPGGSGIGVPETARAPGPSATLAAPAQGRVLHNGQAGAAVVGAPSTATGVPSPLPPIPGPGGRQIERGVSLALSTPSDKLQSTADRVVQTVAQFGGTVASSSVNSSDQGGGQALFDLVVPADKTDFTVTALSALGHVQSLTRDTLDITQPIATARNQLQSLRTQRDGVLRDLAKATTPAQLTAARARLAAVNYQISAAASQLSQIAGRAQNSHINLTIQGSTSQSGGTVGGWDPSDALGSALSVLEVTADVLLVALAFLIPAALLIALPLLGSRTLRRRRREQALVAR